MKIRRLSALMNWIKYFGAEDTSARNHTYRKAGSRSLTIPRKNPYVEECYGTRILNLFVNSEEKFLWKILSWNKK